MKKLLLFAAISLYALTSFAQVSVSSGSPDVNFQIKRAFANGNDVYIDLLVTSYGNWSSISFWWAYQKVFDDEGNFYERNQIQYIDTADSLRGGVYMIEKGLPRKIRIKIVNVDEYAAMFKKIELHYDMDSNKYSYVLTIKDLPITRQ